MFNKPIVISSSQLNTTKDAFKDFNKLHVKFSLSLHSRAVAD